MASPAQRVLERADAIAAFTEDPGRITRPLATPALAAAMEQVREWMEAAGMATRRDGLGNLVGRVGSGPGTLVIGSHLDSVADAGRYDGVLGVLIGLECVQELPLALEVVAFADEEGMRFQSAYLGSRAYLGRLEERDLELRDTDGVTLREAIGGELGPALAPADVRAYFEVHIEQGTALEAAGEPLGVVTAIAGQRRYNLAFEGRAGHAGTTPIGLRADALAAAADFILAAERVALEEPGLVAAVGTIGVPRGAVNVIPGRVEATLDIRHADDAVRERGVAALRMVGEALHRRRGVRVRWAPGTEHAATPLTLAPALAELLPDAPRLVSGAGHDAVTMASVTDAAMLFVRCAGGVSHHPDEAVTEADARPSTARARPAGAAARCPRRSSGSGCRRADRRCSRTARRRARHRLRVRMTERGF
jgi:allantoate deiminase